MIQLDLRTIVVLSGLMCGLMSVVLFSLWRSYPKSIKGLGEWAAAPVIILLAIPLLAMREVLPDSISMVGAPVLLLAGNALFYIGLQRFYAEPPSLRLMVGLLLAWGALLIWFTFLQPHYGVRLVLLTSFTAGVAIAGVVLMLRKGQRNFAFWFVVTMLLFRAVALLWRMLTAPSEGIDHNLFDSSTIQMVYFASSLLALLALTVGLMLLASSRLQTELVHLAAHDPLTSTLMRRAFIDICENELERCRRHARPMALLMLDVDHFKRINDTYGHQMGDRMLVDFVARVQTALRRSDRIGRYGGEEFVVLLPETGLDEALAVAERIRSKVAVQRPGLPTLTVSVGLTVSRTGEEDVDRLLQRSDEALYKAKSAGRNRVEAS